MTGAPGGAERARLGDGRLHLHHGPIDLIIDTRGVPAQVAVAEAAMIERFETVLVELVGELPALRSGVTPGNHPAEVRGRVAGRMVAAVGRHARHEFVTPMAAVAGAVADEIADCAWHAAELDRVVVNNGGDIAVRQHDGVTVVGLVADVIDPRLAGRLHIAADSGIGGIATSGRGGRSLSLGIADAVTVLATTAAEADAVATVVANAVDLPGHAAVTRRPANEVRDDTDLGQRPVTIAVGALTDAEIDAALDAGEVRARLAMLDRHIHAVVLSLRGVSRIVR